MKKITKNILTLSMITLLATGATTVFADDIVAPADSNIGQNDIRKEFGGRERFNIDSNKLKNKISDLSQEQQNNILQLHQNLQTIIDEQKSILEQYRPKIEEARDSLSDALTNAGIDLSEFDFKGGKFDFRNIEEKISSLPEDKQVAINDLKQQIQALREEETEKLGIELRTQNNTQKEKPQRIELTDEQKSIQQEYKAKIDDLMKQINTLLKESGIDNIE